MLIKQRTMTGNSLRGLMAEFGIIVPQGPQYIVTNHLTLDIFRIENPIKSSAER
jgi:hypothetical protein